MICIYTHNTNKKIKYTYRKNDIVLIDFPIDNLQAQISQFGNLSHQASIARNHFRDDP